MKIKPLICPVCEQGHVVRARVKKNGETIYLCDECEAIWFCSGNISFATFNYFHVYMERLGLPDRWTELDYPLLEDQDPPSASPL